MFPSKSAVARRPALAYRYLPGTGPVGGRRRSPSRRGSESSALAPHRSRTRQPAWPASAKTAKSARNLRRVLTARECYTNSRAPSLREPDWDEIARTLGATRSETRNRTVSRPRVVSRPRTSGGACPARDELVFVSPATRAAEHRRLVPAWHGRTTPGARDRAGAGGHRTRRPLPRRHGADGSRAADRVFPSVAAAWRSVTRP